MGFRYLVVGSGMQGTAAAFDVAQFGDAERVTVADFVLVRAQASADRINRLLGRALVDAVQVDASSPADVARVAAGYSVAISAVPYRLHQSVELGCLEARTSVVDMGNDTDVTLEMLARDAEFADAGITLVPDTGLAPGLVNSFAVALMARLDHTHEVRLYCGGLPQNPKPPFNYSLRFSIEGLVGEYVDVAIALRDGEVQRLETLTDVESLHVDGFGEMEAFNTSSGTSTAPYTFAGKVQTYEYKTIRYPGHCALMRVFLDYGFWDEGPLEVDGAPVNPLHVFYKIMGNKLHDPADQDLVITRARVSGTQAGQPKTLQLDLVDYQDATTGFTAMERLTGFSTAIHAIEVAQGRVRRGCVPYELAVPGERFLDELGRRGIQPVLTTY